jgi:hypothetical protein
MRFLAQVRLFERLSGKEQDKVTRIPWGRKIQRLLEGGKVWETSFLGNQRDGFFLMNVEESAEVYETLGPEGFGHCHVKVSPMIPLERVSPLFAAWACEGR